MFASTFFMFAVTFLYLHRLFINLIQHFLCLQCPLRAIVFFASIGRLFHKADALYLKLIVLGNLLEVYVRVILDQFTSHANRSPWKEHLVFPSFPARIWERIQ